MKGLNYLNSLAAEWKGQGVFSLDSMRAVMTQLGNPQDSYKTIHVAGTNGKGSVSSMIASILGNVGYKVGLTTSPHLVIQNERITIDGFSISDELLNNAATEVMLASSKVSRTLSYFEALIACAFLSFRRESVDWAIIEVGLGGRLDATNVILRPEACVIVSIGLDHVSVLGNTLEEITKEKVGIFKSDSIAILGRLNDSCLFEAQKIAKAINVSKIRMLGHDFEYGLRDLVDSREYFLISMHDKIDSRITLNPGLLGAHQVDNAAVAAETCRILDIPVKSIEEGIKTARWPGRLQWISINNRKVLIDCAHNSAGAKTLADYLKRDGISNLNCLFGVLDRPDWKEMISMLIPFVNDWFLMDPPSERKVPSVVVSDYLKSQNTSSVICSNINELEGLMIGSSSDWLATGSIYLIGELVQHLERESNYHLPGTEHLWIRRPLN